MPSTVRDSCKVPARLSQRKVVVEDGLDLAAEYLDFDDGWMSSTIWRNMEDKMTIDKSLQSIWVQYNLVEIAGGSGINRGCGGVTGPWYWRRQPWIDQ